MYGFLVIIIVTVKARRPSCGVAGPCRDNPTCLTLSAYLHPAPPQQHPSACHSSHSLNLKLHPNKGPAPIPSFIQCPLASSRCKGLCTDVCLRDVCPYPYPADTTGPVPLRLQCQTKGVAGNRNIGAEMKEQAITNSVSQTDSAWKCL